MTFWKNKKFLVTGGAGFLGSFILEKLEEKGVNGKDIRVPRSKDTDLRKWENCVNAVKNIDIVIHLAAKVGGIGYNMKYPATLFYDNAIMGIQMMEAARQEDVEKFVAVGTICAYPKFTPVPFKEENLWNGYPEETNAPYGLAKKMMLVQSQAYRQQYEFNSIYLLPVNLYGPRDNFDLESSHVIPALIRKFRVAVENNKKEVEVWGTGKASREFLYVEDAAEAIILATEKYNQPEPVNIGAGFEIKIKDLVELIAELTGFDGEIRWDTTKPNGQPRRCLDVGRAKKEFWFDAKVDFREGLEKTIEWYFANKNVEEVKANLDKLLLER
jgi:GDP-L-fucose synthase